MTGLDNEQSVEFIEENPNEQQIPFVRSGSTFLENDRTDAVKRKKIRQFFDRVILLLNLKPFAFSIIL